VKDSLLKRAIGRSFFPYGSVRTVLFGPCRGVKFRVTRDTGYAPLLGYEKKNQLFLKGKIRPGMTVYDVGAHVGEFALLFAKLTGPAGNVVAFEPNRDCYGQLVANASLNGFVNLRSIEVALGNRDGTCEFMIHRGASHHSRPAGVYPMKPIPDSMRRVTVEMKRLDNIPGLPRPDILKIDTEGSLMILLEGAHQTIRQNSPSFFVEMHGPDEEDAVRSLIRDGYVVETLTGRPADSSPGSADLKGHLWAYRARR